MAKVSIPKGLPKCQLVKCLAEKADKRENTDFDFLGQLEALRKRVSDEVRYINLLFPEYTPHDEQYHLKNLFRVADELLGHDLIAEMNCTELFVLACALYAHDWGMAISETQKEYIIGDHTLGKQELEELWVLPDERERVAAFLRQQRLALDELRRNDNSSRWAVQEYVRQTHHWRSGERVRRYFRPIGEGADDAISRACEAHGLGIDDLNDTDSYPTNLSVLGEQVNIQAIAVYLRLVDLFDLGQDRAPYVIWKFVAPRDPTSVMEWKKHQALQSVTCSPYQREGRNIVVDGSTDDHEVYAALQDLRYYCEQELRGCSDLLNRMSHPYHKLNIYHIEWRVRARGFKPIPVRFEFDRDQMLNILSDEIYQGDRYVFLRELLQNSIDAIRMRRAVLHKNGVEPGNLGVIHVKVERTENGDTRVIWKDDGIGMDEHIVRTYLAVAGKSYYTSRDYERQDVNIDPISYFGIGILSCFMVSDRIEIETRKEPYSAPPANPLRILIPAMNRQFRVEVRPIEAMEVGTTVTVTVSAKKTASDDGQGPPEAFDVVGYISAVAGFVEFPIVISEEESKTVILHPYQDADAARKRFGEECTVRQLPLAFPWEDAFQGQSLELAHQTFVEEPWKLHELGISGLEGRMIFLVPKHDRIDFRSDKLYDGELEIAAHTKEELAGTILLVSRGWRHGSEHPASRSASRLQSFALYRDGILLASIPSPFGLAGISRSLQPIGSDLPWVCFLANLPKSHTPRIDVSRTNIVGEGQHATKLILNAQVRRAYDTTLRGLVDQPPLQRLLALARYAAYHYGSVDELLEVFPREAWPLPFLEAGGAFGASTWADLGDTPIATVPKPLSESIIRMMEHLPDMTQYDGPLLAWRGERCLITATSSREARESLILIGAMGSRAFHQGRLLHSIRFLEPPWEGNPPLLQEVWMSQQLRPSLSAEEQESLLEKVMEDASQLTPKELALFTLTLAHYHQNDPGSIPKIVRFPPPFDSYFAYERQALNLDHSLTQALMRVWAAVALIGLRKSLDRSEFQSLRRTSWSAIKQMPSRSDNFKRQRDKWVRTLGHLSREISRTTFANAAINESLEFAQHWWVEGTFKYLEYWVPSSSQKCPEFGMPLR